jgi:uncharacterized protein (TIGR01777 family)
VHVLVSGATGLIGSALVAQLTADNHQVTRLVRGRAGKGAISWNPLAPGLDLSGAGRLDAVVHLAGENVAQRWTDAARGRIRDSRVLGTRVLSAALASMPVKPPVLVSASAIGIYGDRGDEILTEESPPGNPATEFLVSVCQQWEAAADAARQAGIRVVHPRFGIVLSRAGGALRKMLPVFRLGLGGIAGDGKQWMSWISLDDAVAILLHALRTEALTGPVNATAPEPATNAKFTTTLGLALGRPTPFRVPAPVLRLGLGTMAEGTLLASARVEPAQLLRTGYRFQHPELLTALRHALAGRE